VVSLATMVKRTAVHVRRRDVIPLVQTNVSPPRRLPRYAVEQKRLLEIAVPARLRE